VLPWAEFQSILCSCHPVEPGPAAQALCSTMDLTCSRHVSIFEFDIFTRLFEVRGAWLLPLGRRLGPGPLGLGEEAGGWTPGSGGGWGLDSWV
jgi:hypothetical protein